MQCHGGLAGARAAFDDEHAWQPDLMMWSCSAWIVSTMSRIRPVRLASSAASRADSPVSPRAARISGARSSTSSSSRVTPRPLVLMCRRT